MSNTYTDEQRAEALTLYVEHGAAYTARQTGINKRTISRWAQEANLSADRDLALTEGGERLAKMHEVLRLEARALMIEKIVDLLERLDVPHVEFKAAGAEIHKLVHPIATSGDVRNYVTSVKALVESYRLEMGESTDRTEHTGDLAVTINGVDVATLK